MVIAPRPMRETSRVPRCAVFMCGVLRCNRVCAGRPADAPPVDTPAISPGRVCERGSGRHSLALATARSVGLMAAADAPEDTPDVRADVRRDIREFLSTRRDRIAPDQAGIPAYGGDRRRVPGLRREEVALLAGVS